MKPPHPPALSALVCLLCAAGSVLAQDRAELERTPIVGNRELPKVLYIVPWKKPAAPPLSARPPGGVLDEPPGALDREVLQRQLRLDARRQALADPSTRPATTPTNTPTNTPTGARP